MHLKPSPAMMRGMAARPEQDRGQSHASQDNPRSVFASRFQYKPPADLRLHAWVRSWLITKADYDQPKRWVRIRRIKFWIFGERLGEGLYDKTRRFAFAVVGGKVSHEDYQRRMESCDTCPSLQIVMPLDAGKREKRYCGSCGCPKWAMSRLDVKNKYKKWYCPKRRHEGPYPFDEYSKRIRERVVEITERVSAMADKG